MTITDPPRFEAVRTGLTTIATIRRLHPEAFEWVRRGERYWIDLLLGTDRPRRALEWDFQNVLREDREIGELAGLEPSGGVARDRVLDVQFLDRNAPTIEIEPGHGSVEPDERVDRGLRPAAAEAFTAPILAPEIVGPEGEPFRERVIERAHARDAEAVEIGWGVGRRDSRLLEPSGAGREIYTVVVEAGKKQPSIEVDDVCVFTDEGLDLADREDASIGYREPVRPRRFGVQRIDGAAPKDELRRWRRWGRARGQKSERQESNQ